MDLNFRILKVGSNGIEESESISEKSGYGFGIDEIEDRSGL